MSSLRVEVDPVQCEANGVCVGIVPEVFDLDDDDELHISNPYPTAELHGRVRQAVEQCPKRALFLHDD
jgi:ferredoxin